MKNNNGFFLSQIGRRGYTLKVMKCYGIHAKHGSQSKGRLQQYVRFAYDQSIFQVTRKWILMAIQQKQYSRGKKKILPQM